MSYFIADIKHLKKASPQIYDMLQMLSQGYSMDDLSYTFEYNRDTLRKKLQYHMNKYGCSTIYHFLAETMRHGIIK